MENEIKNKEAKKAIRASFRKAIIKSFAKECKSQQEISDKELRDFLIEEMKFLSSKVEGNVNGMTNLDFELFNQ